MILMRFPIAYAVGISTVLCRLTQGKSLTTFCAKMADGISSFSLMAVPFFITMGVLMGTGGISRKLIDLANSPVKLGLKPRDKWIDHYRATVRNLSAYGVKVIVYNFMPVFDWLRTDLARVNPEDGSASLYFDEADLGRVGPLDIVRRAAENANGFTLPGWEPARLSELETTLKRYESVSADNLRANYRYFLNGAIPVCEECGVRPACHPDDPAWPIFGLYDRALGACYLNGL